jgi:hypothetical protein
MDVVSGSHLRFMTRENEKKRKNGKNQHVFASKVDANGLNARKLSQNGRKITKKGSL